MPMRKAMYGCLMMCCLPLLLVGCPRPIYMPVEPAYDAHGKLRTDGHYVKDSYLRKLQKDLEDCTKP